MKPFIKKLIVASTLLALALFFLTDTPFFSEFIIFTWLSWAFLTVLSAIAFAIFFAGMQMKDNGQFMAVFGISLLVKFFGSLIFLCYFIFIDPIKDKNFIFPFFAIYFIYTGIMMWEVWVKSKEPRMEI